MQVISALAARVRGVSGAGIRWFAKRALMIQPLGWSMYLSGEVMLSRVYSRDVAKIQSALRGLRNERHFPTGALASARRKTIACLQSFVGRCCRPVGAWAAPRPRCSCTGSKTSWLVVFPEGTRITTKALKASQRFMAEQGLAPENCPLRHLLCPRFKGPCMSCAGCPS